MNQLNILDSLDKISKAINSSSKVDHVIDNILEAVFAIFGCDRAWLFHPCDPATLTIQVLAEKYKEEYPGAFISEKTIKIDESAAETIRKAISSGSPVTFGLGLGLGLGLGHDNEIDDVTAQFSVLSQMMMAIHPKIGKSWMFGMHQCSYARVWTEEEQRLFKEISFRVVESLNNLILLRDLNESEKRYRNAIDAQDDTFFVFDPHTGEALQWNKSFEKRTGYSNKEVATLRAPESYFSKSDLIKAQQYIENLINGGSGTIELELICKDGSQIPTEYAASVIRDAAGNPEAIISIGRDISERKKFDKEKRDLESQLRQAHKMEAIGALAGGIAHDFNNILAVILGYAEMSKDNIPDLSPAKFQIEEVLKAGNRAKNLVKQILAFSRKSEQNRVPVQIHLLINELYNFLRSTIPTNIDVKLNVDPTSGSILADPTQIHQILVNLCTNATHAMEEDGGVISIDLSTIEIDDSDSEIDPDLKPGAYVYLSVTDTGIGIKEDNVERIFDPYFTTKDVGKGSGMGLSVVHGIVQSHEGSIKVESAPGKGSSFKLFFPKIEDENLVEKRSADTESLPGGKERIIVVDDEKSVADLTRKLLERLGYHVIAKYESTDVLEMVLSDPNGYDLVITDQTMPKMTGEQLAKELMEIRPDIRVIMCTGFSSRIDAEKAKSLGIKAFAMKPLDIKEFSKTVRKVLDAS